MAQTTDGVLWLGGASGLVRFDGTRFEPFRSLWGDRLLATNVSALFAPRSGGLWIGYVFGGCSFLENGRITNYASELGSPTGTVREFAQAPDGIIWAGTASGLWRFDGSRWQQLGLEWNAPAVEVLAVAFDASATLWALAGVRGATDLLYLLPGSQRFQTAERHLHTAGFLMDASGMVVTRSRGQSRMPDTGYSTDGPPESPVIAEGGALALIDRTHSVWIYSLDVSDDTIRRIRSFSPDEELSVSAAANAEAYHLELYAGGSLIDREGDVWFGGTDGLHRFSYTRLIRADVPQMALSTVAADDDGAVWIGSTGGLAHTSKGGATHSVKELGDRINFAYSAPDKTVWVATWHGLWHLLRGRWTQVDLPAAMANQTVFLQTICQDRTGGIWLSFGRHGLFRLAEGVWTPYGGRNDLPKTGVVISFTDGAGRVWFGYTNNQLAVLDGDRVRVFGPDEGVRVGNITAIYGRGNAIWIGGEFGLQQFYQGQLHTIVAVDDEWLRGISGIVETANGDLWLYGLSGILHIPRAEIAQALDNPSHRVRGRHFGRRQGVPGEPAQLRPLPSAVEGSDGRLWFAGSDGVAWLDPTVPDERVPPPSVTLQSVSADGKPYPTGLALRFPAHTADVQFAYAAVSLSNPDGIRYRYKLEESDKEWTEVHEPSPVTYRNLSPGSYHFTVAATDTDGVWSDKVATAAFAILPAFYQTGWFRALCAAAAVVALFVAYLLRERHLAREFNLTLEARVSERTRIARELHDTLLQSFQGLLLRFQTVRELLRTQPAAAATTLDNVIDQAAQAITEGRNAVQGLRASPAEVDVAVAIRTLGELAADETGNDSTVLRVEVEGTPRELDPIVRDDAYRIAGEALRNAFRHADARQIEVELRYEASQLRLRVRDDGKGMEPESLSGPRPAGHYGIPGMHERAVLLGGALTIWSAAGSGTELELTIPASRAYRASASVRSSNPDEKSSRKVLSEGYE